ncbi:MAG: GH92 family glycosyl hydrolase [Bacteroidales bacterium]|jgi:predicted alpha-1,2-mannosidase|nr:GH92 family glycosyl hydrolase [Bacteroidales bacterium]
MKRFIIIFLSVASTLSVMAGPGNIALKAKATASSSLNEKCGADKVNDGKIRLLDEGEWVSDVLMPYWGDIRFPWIQLDWDEEQEINKIIIYDRANEKAHVAEGILSFSDGSKITIYEIPNNGAPKVIEFPSRRVKWVRFDITDGDGSHTGLSEIEVYPPASACSDYISKVDPYIETTKGRYFFFVTGNQPFGMISAAPLTRNKNQYGGGYNYNSMEILGFPQIHNWVLAGLTLMPTTGEVNPSLGEQHWKSAFSHSGEIVQPAYHRLFMEKYKLWVEQTTTQRVSFYRMTYAEDALSGILINLGGYVASTTMINANVRKISGTKLEGSFDTYGRHWGGPESVKVYFVAEFDKPVETLDGWSDTIHFKDIETLTGSGKTIQRSENEKLSYLDAPTAGICARHQVKTGEQLQVKMSISYVSTENAWENLYTECDHWDFDKVRTESQAEWNNWLGRIDVKGGTEAQQVKFYTDLWHTLLGRHKLDDVNGDYPDNTDGTRWHSYTTDIKFKARTLPKDSKGKSRFHMYNSDAFWLTQWNLNILWGLAWPEVLDDFSASLVQYADNGKLLPRGPCAGGYTYIMTGCPATNLIVSTYTKGLMTKVKPEHAFRVMKSNHEPGGMMGIDEFYINEGYQPNAGLTLEANFQDWALAQMAIGLKKKRDTQYYLKRSEGWKKLYHEKQKLLFPKGKDGKWLHEDPLEGYGWVEANAWQATWSVSHAINELAEMMGGNDTLCAKLNFAFEKAAPQDFVYGYSKGYVSYANQPGCSNAHVFNWAGKPWLTQYWVRRVNEQTYGGITPDKGYGGHDEDQGQMGGVSALMSIGIFSLRGTVSINPVYEITSPVFDEITIQLDKEYYKGDKFIVKTYNNSSENCYIQRASLNGKPLNKYWFYHSDFVKGGLLELWMGPEPNKNWGVEDIGRL